MAELLRATGRDRIIDLCSGGAGPVPPLMADLRAAGLPVTATLTDFYPNRAAFAAAASAVVDSVPDPVDARAVPPELAGVRTLFNAFHHFRPVDAAAVLRDAVRAGQPVGVFEAMDRRLVGVLPMVFLVPLIVLLVTPLVRPFRWDRLVLTYLLPAVPLTVWWDGVVSALRAYTPAELEALGREAGPGYEWRAGWVPLGGGSPGRLTYLLGWSAGGQ